LERLISAQFKGLQYFVPRATGGHEHGGPCQSGQ